MILITKTLVIFSLFTLQLSSTTTLTNKIVKFFNEQPCQGRATSAALVIRPIRSHINLYIADIHTRSFGGSAIEFWHQKKTVKHLLRSDIDCSRFGFCSVVASICEKIVFGLWNADIIIIIIDIYRVA